MTSLEGTVVDSEAYNAAREDVNHWRHVAYHLAGGDRAKVMAASDHICDLFIAAGRERIGPRLPDNGTDRL
jgi:hypothetical protein